LAKVGFPPEVDPRRRHQASDFIHYRRKNNKLSVVSIILAKMMPSAVPASSRRVGSARKLLLNDLSLGFDRGKIGSRLIRLSQRDDGVDGR
jgi:hypothetical protein